MSLKLGGHLFTGPFPIDTTRVRSNQAPVVYAIVIKAGQPWTPSFRVLEVGFSEDTGICFSAHPQSASWTKKNSAVYLYYAPRSTYSHTDRKRLADELREQYKPPHDVIDG